MECWTLTLQVLYLELQAQRGHHHDNRVIFLMKAEMTSWRTLSKETIKNDALQNDFKIKLKKQNVKTIHKESQKKCNTMLFSNKQYG